MFFVISKFLSFILNPLIWIITLLLFVLFIKNSKKKKRLLIITIVVTLFFSNQFIIAEFNRMWEVQPTHLNDMAAYYDVGVVLGGGMITYDGRYQRHIFRVNTDRIMQAVYLYKQKRIGKILISGGSGTVFNKSMREALFVGDYLVNVLGIPEQDVLVESESDNTHQNAIESSKILKANYESPKILLITSAIHMRRSQMCFKKQGWDVTIYSTDLTSGPRRYQFDHLLMPSMHSLIQWNKLLHEWIGVIMYKIVGYA